MSDRQSAPRNGVQVVNGLRFRAVRGELMLPGAVFTDPIQEAQTAAAAKAAADQAEQDLAAIAATNAATAAANAKGATGPSMTTASAGPSKTV